MSLKVQHLTKNYGKQLALNNISFEVSKGEIVGFLGPNGAGKSTTMKIATGYLPPDDGTVVVDGWDVVDNSIQVRKTIGYLPEHNPLYLDMYVHEFLYFIGKIYKIESTELKIRVKKIIELCGLSLEQNKKIETLSKGYRQRVGIAQALIHDPSVLILDEPTSGLDPNQILEIRKLIKEISSDKTVIFSTHIMQEVQALCDRVIVINRGNIVADDTVVNLTKRSKRQLIVEFSTSVPETFFESINTTHKIEQINRTTYNLTSEVTDDVREQVFRLAAQSNISIVELRQVEKSLEDIFHELTVSQHV